MAARIAAGVGIVAGAGFYIRNRSAVKNSSLASVERSAKNALGTKDDTAISDTIKGAYGGKTGGNASMGQSKVN